MSSALAGLLGELQPSREAFLAACQPGSVVPLVSTLLADVETPVSLYARVAGEPGSFLLESVEGGTRWATYSYVGFGALGAFAAGQGRWAWSLGGWQESGSGDPIEALATRMRALKRPTEPGLPRFHGGAVGFFGYDAVRWIERLPELAAAHMVLPEVAFTLPRNLVAFHTLTHAVQLIHWVAADEHPSPEAAYEAALAGMAQAKARLAAPVQVPAFQGAGAEVPIHTPGWTREAYEAAVGQVQEHILAGDVFQLVLSQPFEAPFAGSPLAAYRALRVVNPSPYMYALDFGGASMVGASPELHVRVEGRQVSVRPIAGTRPRGATPEEDAALAEGLRQDPKELAEHHMLVDLGRNDVARVSVPGSVQVLEALALERYSHVMHMVSTVQGELLEGCDAFDALRATFPAGTLSGAPKVRAMEIIEGLEPRRRNWYGGVVGAIGFDGEADLAIAIRTLVLQDGVAHYQAGGGIVADSVPALEYEETLHKSGAIRRALALAAGFGPKAVSAASVVEGLQAPWGDE